MPENITVTLKMEKPGGFWPFVRNTFALIGFAAVVLTLAVLDSPNPQGAAAHMIEAVAQGWRAYETAAHAKDNEYGKAPFFDPLPGTAGQSHWKEELNQCLI